MEGLKEVQELAEKQANERAELKVKVEGNISDSVNDNPYFDPTKPIRVIFIYLGNNDIVEGELPITKNIIAGKFSVKIKILKSKVRGAVIVRYQNCKI